MNAPAAGTRAPKWTPLYTTPGDLVPVVDDSGERTIAETFAWNYTVDGTRYTDRITAHDAVARLWAIAAETRNARALREHAADLAENFAERLPAVPGGHRHDGLLCMAPVFHTGGVRIVPHWPTSLTNHGWTCLNCDTTFSDNGFGAAAAALFVHAHTCGHPRYGLPLGRQVRESVWDQIGADTGWSTALDAAKFTAAENQAAHERADAEHHRELQELNDRHQAELAAARSEAATSVDEAGQRAEALKTDLAKAKRQTRTWRITAGLLAVLALAAGAFAAFS
jgi:hypothetical protein